MFPAPSRQWQSNIRPDAVQNADPTYLEAAFLTTDANYTELARRINQDRGAQGYGNKKLVDMRDPTAGRIVTPKPVPMTFQSYMMPTNRIQCVVTSRAAPARQTNAATVGTTCRTSRVASARTNSIKPTSRTSAARTSKRSSRAAKSSTTRASHPARVSSTRVSKLARTKVATAACAAASARRQTLPPSRRRPTAMRRRGANQARRCQTCPSRSFRAHCRRAARRLTNSLPTCTRTIHGTSTKASFAVMRARSLPST